MTRKLHACTAALAVGAIALMVLASSAQAVPANFWGVVPQATPTAEQVQRLKRGGVDSIRIPIGWAGVQPIEGGAYDWSSIDNQIERAAVAGVETLPFLSGAPEWAVPYAAVPGSGGAVKAPRNLPAAGSAARGWSAFVTAAVDRYGPDGAFWTDRPGLTPRPIRIWQLWNEQNFKYFVVRPNPAEYGKLVKVSYNAMKKADPGAKIVLGGMFSRPFEARFKARPRQAYFATDFLDRLYETTPGIKSKFIGVALHPYTSRFQELLPDIEAFRKVLKTHRDTGKGLWLTEIGWSSSAPDPENNVFAKGPAGQVRQLKGAFRLFERNQVKWRLKRIYWFSVDDQPKSCNFCDGSGLFAEGFVAKRSWFAYVGFAGGRAN